MHIWGTLKNFSEKYYMFNIDEDAYNRLLKGIPVDFHNDKKPFTRRFLRTKISKKTKLFMQRQQLGGREPILVEAKPEEIRYMNLTLEVQIKPYNFPTKDGIKRGVSIILLSATMPVTY